jgi:ATP-dependent Lon protease
MTEAVEDPKAKPGLTIPAGALLIIPMRNRVLFPSMVMPMMVNRPARRQAVEEAVRQQLPIGFVVQRDPNTEAPEPKDLYGVGTAADVLRMFSLPDGQRQVLVQGRHRFELGEFIETDPVLIARVTMLEEIVPKTKEFEARILNLRQEAARALSLLPEPATDLRSTIERIEDPLTVIDVIASTLDLPTAEKQEILAILDPEARAQKVSEKLAHQIEVLELSRKIREETTGAMGKSQRQYFLREQLKAIQRELGEEDGKGVEVEELRRRLYEAKMPPEVEKEALKELSRLERIPEMAPEYSLIRSSGRS